MTRRAHGEGSLLKRKGCRLWYAQFYKDGRRVRVSTGESVRQKALEALRRLMGDSERGLAPMSGLKKIRYGHLRQALLDDYTTRGNRSLKVRSDGTETIAGLKQLDDYFQFSETSPGVSATRITTDAARDFARKRVKEGVSSATINGSLRCLRRMLNLAREDGKIQNAPKIHLLKEPPARRGFITQEQFDELVAALPTLLRPLVLFLYWCGVRVGEAMQIDWTQVDLDARTIRLEDDQTKNGEARILPLPSILVDMLKIIEPKAGQVFSSTNLRTEWASACASVGLGKTEEMKPRTKDGFTWTRYTGLHVHDLRRSAVRNLINAGVPERIAMRITGHKTRAVFDRYHIVSTEDVSNAMRKLESASLANGAKMVQNRLTDGGKLLMGL
jgi:integrase